MAATLDDVIAGWLHWARTAGLAARFAGGIHRSKPPADSPLPYGRVKVEHVENMTTAGSAYVQKVKITLQGYVGVNDPQRQAIARQMLTFNRDAMWSVPHARVMDVKEATPSLDDPGPGYKATEVAIVAAAWEVWIQQERMT